MREFSGLAIQRKIPYNGNGSGGGRSPVPAGSARFHRKGNHAARCAGSGEMGITMEILTKPEVKRFDRGKEPVRQRRILQPITWAASFPAYWKHKGKLQKINMEGLKPPYLLLCNHNAFMDFFVMTVALFPHRANYIVAVDGFPHKLEWLCRQVGCIGKRKFTNDTAMVRQMQQVVRNGDIMVMYPEARYSLCGTDAVLPDSLGKLVKLLKVPVVVLMMHGHHINQPFWNLTQRGTPIEAEMTRILTAEEVKTLPYEEINQRIRDSFHYDDYAWQKEKQIRVELPTRAEKLHKILYQCPHCRTEYKMRSEGTRLWCEACGKAWTLDEYNELHAEEGETKFSHIPDWYEWEREQVREEVRSGSYRYDGEVEVTLMPRPAGFVPIGEGRLEHSLKGFRLTGVSDGKEYCLERDALTMYSCHVEFDYFDLGDCLDLSTLDDTYFCHPKEENYCLTKFALATEEIYQYRLEQHREEKKKK